MEIKVENYLEDEEMKKIVEEEFRLKIKKLFNTESDTTTIITNLGYENIFKIVEEEIPNFRELIKEQVKLRCQEISNYSVFRKKDEFEKENSLGQTYLEEAVEENKDIIKNKVVEIMKALSKEDIANEICWILEKKINSLFCNEESESK